jgi:hypothetical protein
MKTISNINNLSKNIFIEIKDSYFIYLEKFYFFSQDNFLFTLEKTFEKYNPIIKFHNHQWIIQIEKKYSLGSILKDFYITIYKQWLYY